MKEEYLKNRKRIAVLVMLAIPILLTACSSSLQRGDSLVAADEMMDGPGVFSGKDGAFYLVGGKTDTATSTTPINKMNLEETSIAIDNKIKQLDQDKRELELLKRQLKKSQVY